MVNLFGKHVCPKCGSDDVTAGSLFPGQTVCECLECGSTWDASAPQDATSGEARAAYRAAVLDVEIHGERFDGW